MKTYRITVYRADDGWRWRMKASNGRIVADSGEAYATRRGCLVSARALIDATIEM